MYLTNQGGHRLQKESGQLDFHSQLLEDLLRADHPYRKIKEIADFKELVKSLDRFMQ